MQRLATTVSKRFLLPMQRADEGATAYRDAIYNSGIENARDVINAYIAQQEEAAQNAQENQGGAAAQKVQENQEGKGVGTDDVPVVVNRDGGGHE